MFFSIQMMKAAFGQPFFVVGLKQKKAAQLSGFFVIGTPES